LANQRYKIYESEDALDDAWTTPEGMQAWLDWVVKTKFWKERSKVKHIRVVYPVVGAMSGAIKETPHLACIQFGAFSLTMITACHEISHILTWPGDDSTPEEDHGPKFAAMVLEVCKRYISVKIAKKLQKQFDDRGVKYTGGGV